MNKIAILGIPIDNLSLEETVGCTFDMISSFEQDRRPRHICTVNTDFVVNTLAWHLRKTRHPELLDILRKADLVTADGMPMVWTSRLLGTPLKGRVTGADLAPELAREASIRHRSIYLLGGKEDAAAQAARVLTDLYPDLEIAGCECPYVHTEGENLIDATENDLPIAEKINASGADILLIAFGNPKQELWFERNRHRIEVPVSIGIGGTFEFITGSIRRAPLWMQRTGLEWLFRLTQDPKRLWKRYLMDFLKFGALVWPSILLNKYLTLTSISGPGKPHYNKEPVHETGLNPNKSIIHCPDILDKQSSNILGKEISDKTDRCDNIILDLSKTSYIDAHGFGSIIHWVNVLNRAQKRMYLAAMDSSIRRAFIFNKVIDIFTDRIFECPHEAIRHIAGQKSEPSIYYTSETSKGYYVLSFHGDLTGGGILNKMILDIKPQGAKVVANLVDIKHIDTLGIIFLMKLGQKIYSSGSEFALCVPDNNVRQVFRATKTSGFFRFTNPDLL